MQIGKIIISRKIPEIYHMYWFINTFIVALNLILVMHVCLLVGSEVSDVIR